MKAVAWILLVAYVLAVVWAWRRGARARSWR